MQTREQMNALRYDGSERGHYESYFQRANHPTRPLAFWIRYTLFSPQAWPRDALGQLWAVFFDGEQHTTCAVKQAFSLSDCSFSRAGLDVRIAHASLTTDHLIGEARTGGHAIGWDLRFDSPEPGLTLLPDWMYRGSFPKAKALVGSPLAMFHGTLTVDQRTIDVESWVGSQNHNWGEKHTDRYAWGQVAGFDEARDAFFECATASIRVGPVYTPRMSPMVLRYAGEEHRLSGLATSLRASAQYGYFTWRLSSQRHGTAIDATFQARAEDFVALCYENPPGGVKTCLNSKIAGCRLTLRRRGHPVVQLCTRDRAAFEILTDDQRHGVTVLDA